MDFRAEYQKSLCSAKERTRFFRGLLAHCVPSESDPKVKGPRNPEEPKGDVD